MNYKLSVRTKLFKTLLLLFLLPVILFCQTNDSIKMKDSPKIKDSTKTGKFEIGISFSPDYSYRTLKTDASNQLIKDTRDTLESAKFGYSAGINVAYHFNKKLVIEAGLLFSDKGEKTKKVAFVDVPQGQDPIYYSYKYNYYYLDIPLKADYYILTGKLKLYVTAGVSGNIFLIQKTTELQGHNNSDYQKTTSTFNPGFNRLNIAVIAGAGINLKMSDKLNLKLEPIYRRSITSVINAPVKTYLYSAGINIGIYYKL